MTSHASDYPDLPFDPAYKKYFEDFYAITDTPDAHEKYVEFFTPDATVGQSPGRTIPQNPIT